MVAVVIMITVVVPMMIIMSTMGGSGMGFVHRRVRRFIRHGLAVGVRAMVRTGVVVMLRVVRGIHSSPFTHPEGAGRG